MEMQITKENYRDLVWDENISFDDYDNFFNSINNEEKVTFLKFLLEKYPNYDEEWIQHFFDISDQWQRESKWEKIGEFADFVREKSSSVYKKEFNYLSQEAVMYALFQGELELAKLRFEESVNQPDEAIDDSLRMVFNLISTDRSLNDYTREISEKVWKPLEQSTKLIGGAEFNYAAFLYCRYLEKAFDEIQSGESVDWDEFAQNVNALNFKYVEELALLPAYSVEIDDQKFNNNKAYREEKLHKMSVPMLYAAYTDWGIPVYWAFRSWFDLRRYFWESEDAPRRSNWLDFTPEMIDGLGGKLHGFLGQNKHAMIIVMWTVPYFYDWFLKMGYIDEATFKRLMEYYQFSRRECYSIAANSLWMYKGLYSWKKPGFISEEDFEREKALALGSVNLTFEQTRKAIGEFVLTLPKLPKATTPTPPLSPFEKILLESDKKSERPGAKAVSRPKKKRKRKPKPNRARKKKKRKK